MMPFPKEIVWDRRIHGDLAHIERADGSMRPAWIPEWDWPDVNPFPRFRLLRPRLRPLGT